MKQGRPTKAINDRRRKQIGVRVTDAELALIVQRARLARLKPAAYLRHKGIGA